MTAGIATLKEIEANPPYDYTRKLGERLRTGLRTILTELGFDVQVHGEADTYMVNFTKKPIRNARDVFRYADHKIEHDLAVGAMLKGIYVHPGAVGGMLSAVHTEDDIEKTLEIYREVASTLSKS
jgi:glutamate-1-semialdehyde 2,1-aminomutase